MNFKKPSMQQLNDLLEYYQAGRYADAEKLSLSITQEFPKYQFAWKVLASVLKKTGRISESLVPSQKSVQLDPLDSEAHNNLANTLQKLGRLNEAEASIRQAIALKPDFSQAHSSLGNILREMDKLEEAEKCLRQSIALKPTLAEAYSNLGNILKELGRFKEAEISFNKAIEFKVDFVEAHNNLDILLRENRILISILEAKKSNYNNKIRSPDTIARILSNPFISKREVEANLISNLYKIRLKQLDKIKTPKTKGPLFGNGKTSDFRFFENNQGILKNVEEDLLLIMKQAVRSEIFISESFFNIFNNGSGSIPHTHLTNFDKVNGLINQKFSLQYYLSVGDQTCSEPGIFKLNNPDEEILPSNGMVMIIPAKRRHSAIYNGKIDRVMIGVNFYSLL